MSFISNSFNRVVYSGFKPFIVAEKTCEKECVWSAEFNTLWEEEIAHYGVDQEERVAELTRKWSDSSRDGIL
jgi:hypothetical protein